MLAIRLKAIGYWHDGLLRERVHPQRLVDPTWERERRAAIIDYLRAGKTAIEYLGYSYCRFGCNGFAGYRDLTDGVWGWPEGLDHYVEVHNIRLPDKFLKRVFSRNYLGRLRWNIRPELLRFCWLDFTFWDGWCKKQMYPLTDDPLCYACRYEQKRKLEADEAWAKIFRR